MKNFFTINKAKITYIPIDIGKTKGFKRPIIKKGKNFFHPSNNIKAETEKQNKYLIKYGGTKGFKRPIIKKGKDFYHFPINDLKKDSKISIIEENPLLNKINELENKLKMEKNKNNILSEKINEYEKKFNIQTKKFKNIDMK